MWDNHQALTSLANWLVALDSELPDHSIDDQFAFVSVEGGEPWRQ